MVTARSVTGLLLAISFLNTVPLVAGRTPHLDTLPAPAAVADRTGDPARGRDLYHGKGLCAMCHGNDGRLDDRPPLGPDVEEIVTRLEPPPSNLRNPDELRLRTDADRFRLIRHGHSGTGMLPDTRLTDQEIHDLLAYLATLRDRPSAYAPGTHRRAMTRPSTAGVP